MLNRFKCRHPAVLFLVLLLQALLPAFVSAQTLPSLSIRTNGAQVELSWPARLTVPVGTPVFPLYEVQRSLDLRAWQAVTAKLKGSGATNLSVTFDREQTAAFYRLLAEWTNSLTGDGGASVFGYGAAFAEALTRIGPITPEQFAARYALTNAYLESSPLEPTNALYWDLFQADPAAHNFCNFGGLFGNARHYDWRLATAELGVLRTNGFVVSERLAAPSFGEAYYRLWWDDLPVFITTDSILQAWHRSYDNMLTELEETWLFNAVGQMLEGMASEIQGTLREAEFTTVAQSVLDADYFVAVGRSLLNGTYYGTSLGDAHYDVQVADTLAAIERQQLEGLQLFGSRREVDFSQFKPRGHYENSELLRRYFKCLMWLGRIDMRVVPPNVDPDAQAAAIRQLGTAMVLLRALQRSGQYENWQQIDRALQTFVGITDSMTFAQLASLVDAGGASDLSLAEGEASVERLQQRLFEGTLGLQHIRGDVFNSPLGPTQLQLPRSFTVIGQKFVVDSWAFSQTVYDSILWEENGRTNKVCRRMPSCLDVAFAVLGNDQIVPELVGRMTHSPTHPRRDGLPYQHNLAAVRSVIDAHTPESWEANLYVNWLATLRELSSPTTDAAFPDAMRTRAWALKTLNTQMGSWTDLRHDTILYAKQSYTAGEGCSYPDGFVEPRPEFWRRLERMASAAAALIESTPYDESIASVNTNQAGFFRHFANTMTMLHAISQKELGRAPLNPDEQAFLRKVVETVDSEWEPLGYRGRDVPFYDGWYHRLFYRPVQAQETFNLRFGSTKWDAIVADVHTDVPCLGPDCPCPSPGGILHEATGCADMLFIVVNDGAQSRMFAGPVFSHYEFERPFPVRMTDLEWQTAFRSGSVPPRPEWTRSYFVPATAGFPPVRGTHAIAGGAGHALALKTDGTLWSWGDNGLGQFGNGSFNSSPIPVRTAATTRWSSISIERRSGNLGRTLGLAQNGTIWTWGDGNPMPELLSGDHDWHALAGAGSVCAALKTDGSLWVLDATPRPIGSDHDWINITVGGSHFVAIKQDRSLWAWGDNQFGQLGDGTRDPRSEPIRIGTDVGWLGIVAGGDDDPSEPSHTVAVKLDGTLWTWGGNRYGQLGHGTTLDSLAPTQVGSETNWGRIAVGSQHTLALKADGTLWAWGRNHSGQLGDGTTEDRQVPTQIGTDRDWAFIAGGGTSASSFSMALKTDGSLWTWGANENGQLGDGTTTPRLSPVRVGTDTHWGLPR